MMIPAIDLINGEVVRLYQGDYQQKTNYQYTPQDRQQAYADAGANVMHFVDLDGAKDSDNRQVELLSRLVKHPSMTIQVGGGVRNEQDLQQLFSLGADRVVIGSLAIKQPDLVKQWLAKYGPERIVLALDTKIDAAGNKLLPTHGWISDSGVTLESLLDQYQGVNLKHVLCTDISKDGTLQGTNVEMYRELCKVYPNIEWQASGGIGSLNDIAALKHTGVSGVILGRALLEGKFTLSQAIALWDESIEGDANAR